MSDAAHKNSDPTNQCMRCGKAISTKLPHGVCPNCLLNSQLLDSSTDRTLDFGSQPLIDHPEKDLSMDETGNARWVDPLQPGETVGQFEIIKRLGRGGMGTVYEAQDTENKRRVALKVLSRPVDSTEARQRFLREGRLAASINHPNSVFVFGTQQVDRWSLISMELVNGGTLEQQIRKHGPMPPRRAVDAALQIIDGLDAAYSLGVLHRDIKPANCFLSTDGTIKIGDFGLSISTETQPNARITTEGVFLGTPAFSSPEQLRGDALDVRSDIYAFGVTLYFLLTGQTPFSADGMVKLLALVLESSPATPVSIRSEIPKELSRIVMRCLSKEPGDRFRNYAELRTALAIFSSEVPEPASLGSRTIAGMIDVAFLSALSFLYTAFPFPDLEDSGSQALRVAMLVYSLLHILYYATCESAFGQTIGKRMLDLKTVDALGNRPRFSKALIRASIFVLLPISLTLPYNLVFDSSIVSPVQAKLVDSLWLAALGLSSWLLWALLFSTARIRNGQAGLHDLVSDTRVVSQAIQTRWVQQKAIETPPNLSDTAKQIGPYHVLQVLATSDGSEMLVAYDTVMLRRVWLRRKDEKKNDASAIYRASLARSTRLRWLNRLTSGDELWDVYESPTGQPLANRLKETLQWQDIKYILADVSNELSVSIENGTLPKQFDVGHLWVTDAGHVKLLDFISPSAMDVAPVAERGAERPSTTDATPHQQANRLLAELGNRIEKALAPKSSSALPPPLYAANMLVSLAKQGDFKANVDAIKAAVARREVAPRQRRLLMAVAYYSLPMTILVATAAIQLHSYTFFTSNPEICELYGLGKVFEQSAAFKDGSQVEKLFAEDPALYGSFSEPAKQYRRYHAAVAMIAGEKREILNDSRMQSIPAILSIHPRMREQLIEAASSSPPSPADVAAAKELIAGEIAAYAAELTSKSTRISQPIFLAISAWWIYVAIPAAIAGLLFRGGLILHGFQLTVVRMNGRPAGRFRIFIRSCVAIVPAFVTLTYLTTVAQPMASVEPNPLFASIAVLLLLVLIFVSNYFGPRSIPDRMLGTAVVAK